MAVFERWQTWWRGFGAGRPPATDGADPPAAPEEFGTISLDDCALRAYAMQKDEWTEALIRLESSRVDGEIRLLRARLLLGTMCSSMLLLCMAVAVHTAPTVRVGAGSALWTAVAGAATAAVVAGAAAALGRTLRGRAPASVSAGGDPASDRPSGSGPASAAGS